MSFWATDSIVDVFKNLMAGLNGTWIRQLVRLKTPTSSSISEARQRVGPAVMTRLFELVARHRATVKTKGAFLGGLRLMAIDGTVFDVPDTENNSRVFGYPGTRKGTKAAFPKARLVLLVELGTHLITDALIIGLWTKNLVCVNSTQTLIGIDVTAHCNREVLLTSS